MDEVEIIQNHLLSQAGENTDVILGLGYDNTLGSQIGITLIATGFQHKDPFTRREAPRQEAPKQPERIVMTLGEQPVPKPEATTITTKEDLLAPRLIDENTIAEEIPMPQLQDADFDLHLSSLNKVEEKEEDPEAPVHLQLKIKDESAGAEEEKKELERKKQELDDRFEKLRRSILSTDIQAAKPAQNTSQASAASGGYLARPSNIYAESKPEVFTSKPLEEKPVTPPVAKVEDQETFDMQLVIRNDIPKAADTTESHHTQTPNIPPVEEPALQDGTEDQKRRAAERLQKLRNLSFNINAADPNNEFEAVPAYIRRNMELYNTVSSVENFYSNYTVKDDGKNSATISTINSFLDGKKPD
jgi:cell division protein FtsZ